MCTSSRLIVSLAALVAMAGLVLLSGGSAGAQSATNVPVGDQWFCDSSFQNGVCTTEVGAGDTVVWSFSGASLPHTTTACGSSCDSPTDSPLWDSGTINDGSSFQVSFDEPGTYLYRCNIHPNQMRGQIIVNEAAEPLDDPIDVPSDVTDGVTEPDLSEPEVTAPPAAGTGPSSASSNVVWVITVLTAGGIALASAGALGFARRRS